MDARYTLSSSSSYDFSLGPSQSSVCYWGQVFTRKGVLEAISPKDFESFIRKLRNGEYRSLNICQKYRVTVGGQAWVVMGARISKVKRILFTQHNNRIILLDYLPNHDYDKSSVMESVWFKEFYKNSIATETFIEELYEEIDRKTSEELDLKDYSNISEEIEPIWSDKAHFIQLDETQGAVKYTKFPVVVQGPPGVGKSIVGRTVFLSEIQNFLNNTPEPSEKNIPIIHIAYISKSIRLVEEERAIYCAQAVSHDPCVQMHFWSACDFYPHYCTFPVSQVHKWIEAHNKKLELPLRLSLLEILQELHLLYVLKEVRPQDYERIYFHDFCRQKLFSKSEEISAMVKFFKDFEQDFFSDLSRPYVEGFRCHDPIPGSELKTTVLDEGQNASLPELWFFMKKTQNYQLIILQDPKQNQEWQGIDTISLFENIFEKLNSIGRKFSERITLTRNYRCGRDILGYANRILKLRGSVLGGTTYKGEEPLLTVPSDQKTPIGQVRWHTNTEDSQYSLVRQALPENSTRWAVITSPRFIEEARILWGNKVLILTFDQAPGIEFQAVVIYKGLDRALIAAQNPHHMDRALREDYIPLFNRSETLRDHTDIIRWSGSYFTAITRARDLVVAIEPNPSKKSSKALKIAIKALCSPSYSDYSRLVPISLTASTKEEWTLFIRNVLQAGEWLLARDLFYHQISASQEQSFEDWCQDQSLEIGQEEIGLAQKFSGLCEKNPSSLEDLSGKSSGSAIFTAKNLASSHTKEAVFSGSFLSPDELRKYMRILCEPQKISQLRKAKRLNHKDPLYD